MVHDTLHAFYDAQLDLGPLEDGPLTGLTFAAKEAFDVKGHVTSGGNPDWARTHGPAQQTARAIDQLLRAGAHCIGKTHTDELMYGLNGENIHFGTPINPKCPQRIPGGSSSGSAAAVAGELTDFAIGTDTGGSVRIPASYTGIYGFRPTVGRTSLQGAIPLSQTFDTVGCMARKADILEKAASVLIAGTAGQEANFSCAIMVEDVAEMISPEVRAETDRQVRTLGTMFEHLDMAEIAPEGLDVWSQAFRIIQGYDIWQNFGEWITAVHPHFGPGFAERFAWTGTISRAQRDEWCARREGWKERVYPMLGSDTLLLMPTAPGPAPLKNTPLSELNPFRDRVLQMTAIAGLLGLPQVSLPLANYHGLPLGISVIGGPGTDEALLAWVHQVPVVYVNSSN
jgi:amidase